MLTNNAMDKSTLLIVDDQPDNIYLIAHLLADDYNILFTLSGAETLALLEKEKPDLILLDVMMQDMDGYEVCKRLKDNPDTAEIPIIFVTARNDDASESRALITGAVDFIHKPVNRDVLLARVNTHIQLKKRLDLLRELSTLDPLTGLANRRLFFERLTSEWLRAMRQATPLAVMLIDIDFFKAYNDYYGHIAGDHCLCKVAQTIASSVSRVSDLAARYGGEEFVVYMANTTLEQAMEAAEKVRARVEGLAILNEGRSAPTPCMVTVSIGVSCVTPYYIEAPTDTVSDGNEPAKTDSTHILIQIADQALYQSKQAGRNRVTAFTTTRL